MTAFALRHLMVDFQDLGIKDAKLLIGVLGEMLTEEMRKEAILVAK